MTVYKVMSETRFMGHEPGEEFEAELDEATERRAKERGSIRVVRRNHKAEQEEEGDE